MIARFKWDSNRGTDLLCRFWWFFTSSFKLGSIFVNWWLRLLYVAFLILNLFSFFPDLQLDFILLIKLYFLVRNLGNQQPVSFCHIFRTVALLAAAASIPLCNTIHTEYSRGDVSVNDGAENRKRNSTRLHETCSYIKVILLHWGQKFNSNKKWKCRKKI